MHPFFRPAVAFLCNGWTRAEFHKGNGTKWCLRKRTFSSCFTRTLEFRNFANSSVFQPLSIGLGCRAIPALGGGAQQF